MRLPSRWMRRRNDEWRGAAHKRLSSLLKNALVAFFNLAKGGAKLRPARKITTSVAILGSHPCDHAGCRIFQQPARRSGAWPAARFRVKAADGIGGSCPDAAQSRSSSTRLAQMYGRPWTAHFRDVTRPFCCTALAGCVIVAAFECNAKWRKMTSGE